MEKKYIYRLFVVVVCLLCSVSTFGQEAYAVYRPDYTRLTFYYDDLRATRGGTSYDLNTGSVNPGWYLDGTMSSVTRVVFNPSFVDARPTSTFGWFFGMENLQSISDIKYLNTSEVTDMTNMFRLCSKLPTLDVSRFNTEKVTGMANMFWQCELLTTLDVSGFVTDNVTSMKNMFIYCKKLKSLDVSRFNTENVTNMADMFHDCRLLTSIDVSNFDTQNVTDMGAMFQSCSRLKSLDLSHFNTSNVTNMKSMFVKCVDLTSLDMTSFNTSNVTNMQSMFNQCESLTSLDLSNFNTMNVTNMSGMFESCIGLTTIYVGSGWSTAAVTVSNTMFSSCYNLVGGQGTTYDDNCIDATYAHIDGGTSNPGYFTGKSLVVERGDVDGDSAIDINDVTLLINVVLGQNQQTYNSAAADCDVENGDGSIDINDVTALLGRVLSGAWN